jgi:BirA family biotin operon repressor/biotin-[acetyl-CoA-carboxylase] ligase
LITEKQKQILSILADAEFHSGTELAQVLGISRSAIWKYLTSLGELGLSYKAVQGKGYRLDKPLHFLSSAAIYSHLSEAAKSLITALEIYDQLLSTNTYLSEQAQKNPQSGLICLAEHQTLGKGRRGRQWVSPFGSNIYLSVLWCFQQGPSHISGLSLVMGVAVIRALREYGIENIGLKWPNDIFWQAKKLGGILIEVSGETSGPCCAVIGLGLNLALSAQVGESITQPWTDLESVVGASLIARNKLVASLLNHMLIILNDFEQSGLQPYLDEWRSYDCLKYQPITLQLGSQQINGVLQGIDDNGLLLLQHADGRVQGFASGEVSFNPETHESAS